MAREHPPPRGGGSNQQVGRYQILNHIASGGMGAVYKAVDIQLRRTVALKVLRAHRAQNDRDLERFNREARNSALLTHPNIVTTYDYGFDVNHCVYFLTMEFIEGYDLARHIARRGMLSPKETRNILIQTAEALAHAFDQGVVHRDIKPSNFILARVGGKVVVKLADFGLALGSDEDEFKVTKDGTTVGTIDYMAPEQARDSRAADIRSDIYSLGCTAYHMLTGNPPFAEGGIGERVHKHMHVAATDVRDFNPAVSSGLWEIVRTMLAKNPADRYGTPREMLVALKKVVAQATAGDAHTPTLQPLASAHGGSATGVMAASATRTTSVSPATVTEESTSETEIPKPAPKRSRLRAKKRRTSVWPFVITGGVICAMVVAGAVGYGVWQRFSPNNGHAEGPITKVPPEDSKPVKTVPDTAPNGIPIVAPVKPNAKTLPVLDLKQLDWPGRALVPFDAVAPRSRLDEIKGVQLKGSITLASSPNPLSVVLTWESLKRLKCQETSKFAGAGSTYLLAGNHGWLITGGINRAVSGDLLSYFQTFHHATMLGNLLALNEGGLEIEKTSDAQVRKKDCFSVLVKHAQRPSVRLYFDKQSNLLSKAELHARMVDKNLVLQPNATLIEVYFSNYQVSDGVNHWRRLEQWRDGKLYSEMNLREIHFLKNVDDAYFSTPGLDESARRALIDYRKDTVKNALFKIGSQPGSDLTRLVGGLSNADASVRWTARGGLRAFVELWRKDQAGMLQSSDVNALATLALAIDDELPWFAVDALAKLGPQAAAAAPHLVSLAQATSDPGLQARTISALKSTKVRSDQTLDLYATLLEHADANVKDLAALAILQLGPEKLSTDRLADLLGWKNRQISGEAEKHLRQRLSSISEQDLPALKQGLGHSVREVQLAYLDALGSLQTRGADAAPDLVPLIKSPDKVVAEQAMRTLERIGKLAEFARDHSDAMVVAASLAAMKRAGAKDSDSLAIYEKQLDHAEDRVKDTAALALVSFAPERLSTDRLVEFMARPQPLDLAATLALHKSEPSHAELRSRGVAILATSLDPDLGNLKVFLAEPLKTKNAAVLLDIGGPQAVAQAVKQLLENNDPKSVGKNQKLEATATRFLGYELLKEFAKTAQAKQDRALISALKKHEANLSNNWAPSELSLTKNLNQTPDLLQLRNAAAESARQASVAIKSLRTP
jgi:serine/threonine protein kinase